MEHFTVTLALEVKGTEKWATARKVIRLPFPPFAGLAIRVEPFDLFVVGRVEFDPEESEIVCVREKHEWLSGGPFESHVAELTQHGWETLVNCITSGKRTLTI